MVKDQRESVSRNAFVTAMAATGATFVVASFSPAQAAQAAQPAAATSGNEVQEVIVTAQKRSENLQNVPLSVQVVTSEALAQKNQNSMGVLAQTVPGLHIEQLAPGNEIFLRGIGSSSVASFDQSVATFSDDVFHGRSRMSQATFLDLDHVEVLKGPQSTFFGNNAIAGALNIVTKKPSTQQWDGWARAAYGTHSNYALEGATGGPINDSLAIRVAAGVNGSGGWLTNVDTGKKVPVADNQGVRLTLLFHPNEDFNSTFKAEASHNVTRGAYFGNPTQIVTCPSPAFAGPPKGTCALDLSLGKPIGLIDKVGVLPGEGSKLETTDFALTNNYQHWGHTFTSVTAFTGYHSNLNFDVSGTGIPNYLTAQLPERYSQISQELRVASPTGHTLEYLAGVYYQHDVLSYSQAESFFFAGPGPTGPSPLQQFEDRQVEDSYSVFGSLTWNLTDRLKASAGLRGSSVKKSLDYEIYYGAATQTFGGVARYPGDLCTTTSPATGLQLALGRALGTPACAFDLSRSDHAWTPSAKIQYQIAPDAMAYARFDRGFKAGGFNGTDATGLSGDLAFAPESVTAFEVGLKTEWFDKALLMNVDAFHSKYNNLQVNSFITLPSGANATIVNNAAASLTQGVELVLEWRPTEHFGLSANGAYIDARYLSYPNGTLTGLQSFCAANPNNTYCLGRFPPGHKPFSDQAGFRLSPNWTGNIAAFYRTNLSDSYRLTAEVSSYLTSDYYMDVLDDWRGAYARVDARITLEPVNRAWAVDLIAKNLTDETIVQQFGPTHAYPLSGLSDWASKEEPRNFAVQVRYKW